MKAKKLTLVLFISILGMLMNSCSFLQGTGSATSSNSLCSNYNKLDESKLEIGLVLKMTELYQTRVNGFDAKAVWFDLEILKKFMYHLEMEAKKNNISSQDLGVRIYYGRYPEIEKWTSTYSRDLSNLPNNSKTSQYEMLHTVVMIPTIKKINNKGIVINQDFDPFILSTYSNGFNEILNSSNTEEINLNKLIYGITISHPSTINARNHGSLHPPYSEDGMDFIH